MTDPRIRRNQNALETLDGQRGNPLDAAVRKRDLDKYVQQLEQLRNQITAASDAQASVSGATGGNGAGDNPFLSPSWRRIQREIEEEIDNARSRIIDANNRVDQLAVSLQQASNELRTAFEAADGGLRDDLNDASNQIAGLQQILSDTADELRTASLVNSNDIHDVRNQLTAASASLSADLDQASDEIDEVRNQLIAASDSLSNDITLASNEIDVLQNDLAATADELRERIKYVGPDARSVDERLDQLTSSVTWTLQRLLETRQNLSDAGIFVDPNNGVVRIEAFEQVDQRVSDVSIQLDAVESTLNLKTSVAQVNQIVSNAVLDPTQIPVLDDFELRLTSAEVELSGLEAEVQLKADATIIDGLEATLTQATVDIDALEAAINLKVEQSEFDDVTTRLADAEVELQAFNGASFRVSLSDQRRLADAQEVSDVTSMQQLWEQLKTRQSLIDSIALAENQLYAVVNDGFAAEAEERLILATKLGQAESSIEQLNVSLSDTEVALATSITDYTALFGQNEAAIQQEAIARADADEAITGLIDTITATFNSDISTAQATANQALTAAGDNEAAITAATAEYTARFVQNEQDIAANEASISSETIARADADSALGSQITTLSNEVGQAQTTASQALSSSSDNANAIIAATDEYTALFGQNEAAIQQEAIARATEDDAINGLIVNLTTDLGEVQTTATQALTSASNNEAAIVAATAEYTAFYNQNTADIQAESIARADADSALAGQVSNLGAQVGQAQATADSAVATSSSNFAAIVAATDEYTALFGQNEAAIQQEAVARANGDDALSGLIQTVSTNVENAQTTADQALIAASESGASFRVSLSDIRGLQDQQETADYSSLQVMWEQLRSRQNIVDQIALAENQLYAVVNDGLQAEAEERLTLATKLNQAESSLEQLNVSLSNTDMALAASITNYTALFGQNEAAIQEETIARADADEAITNLVENLNTAVGDAQSTASQAVTAASNNEQAIVAATQEYTALFGQNEAAITAEQIARADADTALTTQVSNVEAVANSRNRTFSQDTAPQSQIAGDIWYKTDDNNRPYRWNGTAWVLTDDTRIAQNTAAITTEQTARADADSALAGDIATVSAATGVAKSTADAAQITATNAEQAVGSITTTVEASFADWDAFVSAGQTAVATAQYASSALVFRTVAGGGAADIGLFAWDDEAGAGSAIKMKADDILLEGTVGAKQLVVTDFTNLIVNNTLENDDGWTFWPTVSIVDAPSNMTGDKAFLITATTSGFNQYARYRTQVQPESEYLIKALCRASGDEPRRFSVRFGVWFYSRSGAVISTDFQTVEALTGTDEITVSASVTAPAGAVTADVAFGREVGSGEANDGYIGSPQMVRKNGGELIVDGSITADKLQVDSLDAVSGTIGHLKSAPSGERVEIEDDRISVYDSQNRLRVRMGRL